MSKINFNVLQLIIESSEVGERFIYPKISDFRDLNSPDTYTSDGNYYEIVIYRETEYIWMTFDYGNPNPRDEKITNVITTTKRDNDRKENETELLSQLFALYDGKGTLYISNAKKKAFIESYLKTRLKIDLIIKHFSKTEDEIINILKNVDKIQFSHATDLFNQDSKQRQALKDLTGIDAPNKFTIEAEYKKSTSLTKWIKQLFEAKNKQQIMDLIICGRNEDNFSFVYNMDTFSRKIDVDCGSKSNKKLDQEEVLRVLLTEIERKK